MPVEQHHYHTTAITGNKCTRDIYEHRQQIVEPVIGDIKENKRVANISDERD